MRADHLNRRDLLVAAGATASWAGLAPSLGWAASVPSVRRGEITDMTMNSPSYATPIGYGRPGHPHDAGDPLAFAFSG
jgi:hypothetical protein